MVPNVIYTIDSVASGTFLNVCDCVAMLRMRILKDGLVLPQIFVDNICNKYVIEETRVAYAVGMFYYL